jgi:hypothetical protein
MFVSGHLQLNQTNHFKILEPFELNQIWQSFANCNYGANQTLFKIVFWPNLRHHLTPTCPLALSLPCQHGNPRGQAIACMCMAMPAMFPLLFSPSSPTLATVPLLATSLYWT